MLRKKFLVLASIITLAGVVIMCDQMVTDQVAENSEYSEEECTHDRKLVDTTGFVFPNHENNNCVSCHQGIEPIRDHQSGMMQEIFKVADKSGFKDNECIVCHGGDPETNDPKKAHQGSTAALIAIKGPDEFLS